MIGCRADGLRSLRERYAVVARRACEKPISRVRKRVNPLPDPGISSRAQSTPWTLRPATAPLAPWASGMSP